MVKTRLPQITPKETVYENRYQKICRVEADFGEFVKEYFVTDTGERAGIVAVRNESILLVRQYRLMVNGLSWEIPGGRVNEGEKPQVAAVRECFEEAGVRCLNPLPLAFYHQGLDTSHNPTYIFYSEEVEDRSGPHTFDPREVSECEWVSLTRCMEMVSQGQIMDAFTLVGLLSYQLLAGKQ